MVESLAYQRAVKMAATLVECWAMPTVGWMACCSAASWGLPRALWKAVSQDLTTAEQLAESRANPTVVCSEKKKTGWSVGKKARQWADRKAPQWVACLVAWTVAERASKKVVSMAAQWAVY
jgi:hypothetical protein